MPELILASASEARAALLGRAGLTVEAVPARIDEAAVRDGLVAGDVAPRDVADALAEAKALKISRRHSEACVLGADQVLDLDGRILTKCATPDDLRRQLGELRGRSHRLWSAAVVAEAGRPVWRHVGRAELHMRDVSDAWLDGYVARAWPAVASSVGGYHIEGEGVRLFDAVHGDLFTVIGLPLVPLLSWLALSGRIPG